MPTDGPPLDRADWIEPSWDAPSCVRARMTTRHGGISEGPFDAGPSHAGGLNLGLGSGDAHDRVEANRGRLAATLPAMPRWLRQVHGRRAVDATVLLEPVEADASYTDRPGVVCAVLVADCAPVLFATRDGTRVAAAHAGWRGLVGGVLDETLAAGGFDPAATLAWVGPCIGPTTFEVGSDVRDAFIAHAPVDASAFVPHRDGKWMADLPALVAARLARLGVPSVVRSGLCTVREPDRFYSYRRDRVTGRMAALVWIAHGRASSS